MRNTHAAWAWVTADRILAKGPCDLIYALLVPSAAAADASLYDGFDSGGKLIATLEQAAKTSIAFDPPEPILCTEGLFVDVGSNTTGVLVMYRPLNLMPAKET